jgi:hypothetical protein
MSEQEAQAELMILRGLATSGHDLALVRERIDRLYWAVCRKHLRKCRCKNVEKDALLEIYAKLMYQRKSNKKMAQAKLVNGVVLKWQGNHYTNANLTDEVAREFLSAFPVRKDWFAVLPSATTEKQVVAEVAEMPSAEVEPEKGTATPKKKKSAKKRK